MPKKRYPTKMERKINGEYFSYWKKYRTKKNATKEANRMRKHDFMGERNARTIKAKNYYVVYVGQMKPPRGKSRL